MKRAVVLLSGGLDSATTLAVAQRDGFLCYALTINYGQRHQWELEAARQVARALNAAGHQTLKLDLRAFGGSALTAGQPVPKDRELAPGGPEIPPTYVPARNTIFLALALAWAEVLGAEGIFIGANAIDYSGYPDCRPEFLAQFNRLANLALKATVEKKLAINIHAPLLNLTKAEIIRLGTGLGVDFALTKSCYDPSPNGLACGRCDSCQLRRKGFAEAGLPDPTRYVAKEKANP